MNIKELGEDLEKQFWKPRNITEENVCFMFSLVKEEFDGESVDEDVEKSSLDAFGMTILAVMSYQTTPWEELAKKPSIRKTLKYIAIRGGNHYDEIEALTKDLMRKHFDGITQKMVLGFLKIIRGLSNEERPTKLIEYTPFPAQYYAISHGLHQIVKGEHPDDAAAIIHCAIEDGILFPTVLRSLLVDEFNLKKSSFDKYFNKYHISLEHESDTIKKQTEEKIKYHRKALRNAIGYTLNTDGTVIFHKRKLERKNFLSIIIAYFRSILRILLEWTDDLTVGLTDNLTHVLTQDLTHIKDKDKDQNKDSSMKERCEIFDSRNGGVYGNSKQKENRRACPVPAKGADYDGTF